jgi:hypothetical protein
MAKMREVRVVKPGAEKGSSPKKEVFNTYTNSDGVKVTICKPGPEPKKVTARC